MKNIISEKNILLLCLGIVILSGSLWKISKYNKNKTSEVSEINELNKIIAIDTDRIENEMGKIPTEKAIKAFINSIPREFKKSKRDNKAIEDARMKLHDARVSIRTFSSQLKEIDKNNISSEHIKSLWRKLKHARKPIDQQIKIQNNLK